MKLTVRGHGKLTTASLETSDSQAM